MELPLSLSVVTDEKMTVKMIERGTALPASKTRIFTAGKPLPSAVMIELVAGERFAAKDNERIVRLRIGGIKKTVGNIARIAVKVEVSEDGTILFEAFDYGSHHKKSRVIQKSWIPGEEKIAQILSSAQEAEEEETLLRDRCRLISRAKAAEMTVRSINKSDRASLSEEDYAYLKEKAADIRKRIRKADARNLSEIDSRVLGEEITSIRKILEKM